MLGMKRVRAGALCALLLMMVSWSAGAQEMARPAWFPTTAEESQTLHARVAQGVPIDGIMATFAVNTTDDTVDANPGDGTCADAAGNCSLRAAVMEANASAGGDSITVPSGHYILTLSGANEDAGLTGDLDITDPDGLILTGPATGEPATLDGNASHRVLDVRMGASVSLSHVEIAVGEAENGVGGGMMVNDGALAVLDTVIVAGNRAIAGSGGGIYGAGGVYIFNSLIANNAANNAGGGLYLAGPYFIANTTISGNEAGEQGGGLMITSDNPSNTSGIEYSTITNNRTFPSPTGGGGIYLAGPMILRGNILAGNASATTGPDCSVEGPLGLIISQGDNLLGNNTGCDFPVTDFSDQIGTGGSPLNPLLGPLADNGGRTPTHAPLPDSSARDVMRPENCAAVARDQRGVARPQDADTNGLALCDIGAVEVIQPFTLASPGANGAQNGLTLDLMWTAADGATKYKVEVRGTNKPFSYTRTRNAAKACQGLICRDTRAFAKLPNQTTMRWRVTALGLPSARVSPWQPFRVDIPGKPAPFVPPPYGLIADPTPFLVWYASGGGVNEYVVRVRNNAGKIIRIIKLNPGSTPSIRDSCADELCGVNAEDFGLALVVGRTYSWSVEATQTVASGGTTTRYRSRSAWWPFTIVSDPPLLDGAGADGLRGIK